MPLTKEREDQITRAILEAIATGLENGTIHNADSATIADFWEGKVDSIKTEEDLLSFLLELSQKWPVFANLYTVEKGKKSEANEQQVTQDVVALANKGKIDEAVDLAKTATGEQ